MIRYYLTLAIRNLKSNKLTKLVKIVGMALAISVSMIILLFVHHEQNFDRFFTNHENVYRLINNRKTTKGNETTTGTPIPIVGEILQNIPEVKSMARFSAETGITWYYNDKIYNPKGVVKADSSFFTIYNVNLVAGKKETVLSEPFSIAISQSFAKKVFGDEPALGKIIKENNQNIYVVTGVFEDFPSTSFLCPEIVFPIYRIFWWESVEKDWASHFVSSLLLLNPGTNLDALSDKINNLVAERVKLNPGHLEWDFSLQPVTEIHTEEYDWSEMVPGISRDTLTLLIFVALFILFVAWLNHVNISSNLRLKLLKQNSIEKVYGMEKKQQFHKILTETLSDFYLSFFLAVALVVMFMPLINQMLGKNIGIFSNALFWFLFIVGICALSVITAIFESGLVSRVNFINAVKGQLGKNNSGKWIKKSVLVTQYSVAIILIFITAVVFMQTKYLLNRDIGLEKENIFVVKGKTISNDRRKFAFLDEIRKLPEVKSATFANVIPGTGDAKYKTYLVGQSPEDVITNMFVWTDSSYIETFNIPLIAGENIRKRDTAGVDDVIISDKTAAMFGYKDYNDIIGKFMVWTQYPDRKLQIKGIFKNFEISSLNTQETSFGESIIIRPQQNKFLAIKYSSSKPLTVVNKVQKAWKDYFGINSINYFFLDEHMHKIYKSEIVQRKIFILFALTAILIAGFGLFAMAFETIIQRTKEIGIRKVNGANAGNILKLLFSDYIGIFLISIIPGLMIAYYASQKWLEEYYYRITISWYYFLIPLVLIAFVTLLSILYHSFKAAVSNPINSLKYE